MHVVFQWALLKGCDHLYGLRSPRAGTGFTFTGDPSEFPVPGFAMTFNKVAELVQLFGPALYSRNPHRQVNPRKHPLLPIGLFGDGADPNVQMGYQQLAQNVKQSSVVDSGRALLLETWLNYTPDALDLKRESRWAIDEALIKGLGVLWSELYQPSGAGNKLVGSFFDTVDNLLIDPDSESLKHAKWTAKRCVHPYWEVERVYGLPEGSLKKAAGIESYARAGEVTAMIEGDYRRKQGLTNDLMVYWKIFSKMGLGGLLSGVPQATRDAVRPYGDFCYLAVADGIPWPLNVPPPLIEAAFVQPEEVDPQQAAMLPAAIEEVRRRVQWPTPYWADDRWPFTPIAFHPVPRRTWPMSHMAPAMGELKFLNWAFSFLAGKVRTACRDFIAVAKSSGEELKDRIKSGPDYTILEVEALHGKIDDVVSFLRHPDFNPEIWKVIEGVTLNFERRTGLTELMYGLSAKQIRSAQEASVKSDNISVRPDDMAEAVEQAMTDVARMEALCSRWHLTGQDVAPVLGPLGAQWWDQLVTPSDPAEILHSLEYRIEAGSVRKPNRTRDIANMNQAMQQLFQPLWAYGQQSGDVGPINSLITAWAKVNDLDASSFILKPPAPPPLMPPVGGPPNGAARPPVTTGPPTSLGPGRPGLPAAPLPPAKG